MKEAENNLVILDNKNLKEIHAERFLKSQEKIAESSEKRANNVRFQWLGNLGVGFYTIGVSIFLVLMILLFIFAVYYSQPDIMKYLKNLFYNPFVCSYEGKNMSFGTAGLALDFKELFPNETCYFRGMKT